MRRHLIVLLVSVLALSASASAQVELYGAGRGTAGPGFGPSYFYKINPANGTGLQIGPIGFDNVTGMAILDDGRVVASARGDDLYQEQTAIFIEINPSTGAGTLIGVMDNNVTGNCGRMTDLTFDTATSTLFAYGDFCSQGDQEGLYTVDTTSGQATLVGGSGYSGGGNGLAADPFTLDIFATPFDDESLVMLDRFTGDGTEVPGSDGQVPYRVSALDFHPANGKLYGVHNAGSANHLVSIDTADGTTSAVGQTVDGLDALAFISPCRRSATSFCLNDDRFEVSVGWKDFGGVPGEGRAAYLRGERLEASESGVFYYFSPDNWELTVKVLDGCPFNNYYWVFAAASTNVEYTITVVDTKSNATMSYTNPLGNSAAAITDITAFSTCP